MTTFRYTKARGMIHKRLVCAFLGHQWDKEETRGLDYITTEKECQRCGRKVKQVSHFKIPI